MAPVILELYSNSNFESPVRITTQHREILDQLLAIFGAFYFKNAHPSAYADGRRVATSATCLRVKR